MYLLLICHRMLCCGGVLLFSAFALADFTHGPSVPLDSEWESWKTAYNREYSSQEEERTRRAIWEKNMRLIDAHNQAYKQGMYSYELGMNHLGDLTSEEVTLKMTGLQVPRVRRSNSTFLSDGDLERLPKAIDYRKLGYVTPVINQGSCGACWAISAAGALEGQMMKTMGKLVPLSPQNLVDCATKASGCTGGFMTDAFDYIISNKGIDSEKAYPYVGKNQTCAYNVSGRAAACNSYKEVDSGDERALRVAVARVGPVSAAVNSKLDTFRFYRRGVYRDRECSADDIDHAVLVVGYGATCRGKYWIIKNSWGKEWGMKGYMLLARNCRNLCGIATLASYPII